MLIYQLPNEAWHDDAVPLLPTHILADEWVLYHGTSNLCENDIETTGFQSRQDSLISLEVVQRVLACFSRLNWYGNDQGGYVVLKSYTALHDYSYKSGKPIFLGLSCRWSLLYATRDFAGGEGCRGLRKALHDLHTYLADEDVRVGALTQCIDNIINEYGEVVYEDMVPLAVEELTWLQDELTVLQPVREYVDSLYEQYRYGIVYAIKFNKKDIANLFYANGMGITHVGTISRDKIVAKLLTDGSSTAYNSYIGDRQRFMNMQTWHGRVPHASAARIIQIL